tara:strand:+ start:21 stop:518 length:498 start_codon:yes stop_codon:yes gene_type:complete
MINRAVIFTSILIFIIRAVFFKFKYSEATMFGLLTLSVLATFGILIVHIFQTYKKQLNALQAGLMILGGLLLMIQIYLLVLWFINDAKYLFITQEYPGFLGKSILLSFILLFIQLNIFTNATYKYILSIPYNKFITIIKLFGLFLINVIPMQEIYNMLINFRTDG